MKIIVLMSTYNGSKFLEEQLDSIISQDVLPNKLLIRDDGSSDDTIRILDEYSKRYSFIEYYIGNNIGPAKSFFELINRSEDADYYALADQDDMWFANKISKAIKTLSNKDNNQPLLYCGRFILTDEKLNPLNSNISSLYSYTDFAHSLLYQTAPGCTFVFNNEARKQITKYDINNNYCMIHDSIIHKIIAMFGEVVLDLEPCMYYRQHKGNAIGLTANKAKSFINRINHFIKGRSTNTRSNMAKALLDVYRGDSSIEKLELLNIVANYKNNNMLKRQLLTRECFKTHTINDLFFDVLVLLNYI